MSQNLQQYVIGCNNVSSMPFRKKPSSLLFCSFSILGNAIWECTSISPQYLGVYSQ